MTVAGQRNSTGRKGERPMTWLLTVLDVIFDQGGW